MVMMATPCDREEASFFSVAAASATHRHSQPQAHTHTDTASDQCTHNHWFTLHRWQEDKVMGMGMGSDSDCSVCVSARNGWGAA
jgi:hypothetical protein